MIRFFYRAGSTETREKLTQSIREDLTAGLEVLLLVPEQETVSVERRMLERLPASAQLSFEVLNFSRLANRVFRTVGGLSYKNATSAVSALLMWRTVGSLTPFYKQYRSEVARDSALCELMLRTEAQCKAAMIDAERLLEASEALPVGEPLADKLHDVGLTLSTFEATLGERFDNAADELTRLADVLAKQGKALFGKTHVYVDSFTDFTAQELAILRALFAAAPSVTVTFPLENGREDGLHLATVTRSHKHLLRMAREQSQQVFFEQAPCGAPTDALRYLSRHLFDMTAEPAPLAMAASGQISLYACPSPFEEAAHVAATIHRLVREGHRYRDVVVVVRDTAQWLGILDAALEKEGIPYFLSEKTDVTTRPLVKLLLLALRIRLGNWREEDVIGYLKTGLVGVCSDDVNLFEEYAAVWHPKGEKAYNGARFDKNPDGFTTTVSKRGARIAEGANRVREQIVPPLLALFARLDEAENATTACGALYDFLETLGVREQLKREAEKCLPRGERREAQELSRLYGVTLDALEAVSLALGNERLTVSELADALKLVFARTDIGTIPTSADEVVVGSASMLRTDHPKFVIAVGLCEGSFPRTVTDEGLLLEADKQRLAALGIEFPTDNARLSSDELFYVHRAFSAPTDALYLSYSGSGADGRALTPSIAVDRVKRLFPTLPEALLAAEDPMEHIYTPAAAMEALCEFPPESAAALLELLESRHVPAVKSLRRPVCEPNAAISAETAKDILTAGRFNPTHLERFSACRFAYYCSKVLKLREEPSDIMSSAEVGNFIHYVLEKAIARLRDDTKGERADPRAIGELVEEIAAEYRARLTVFGEPSPRASALLRRLCALARLVITGLARELSDSAFTPTFLELDLSTIGEKPSIRIGDTVIPLSGKIDRVDFWQAPDGRAYLRVTDYKTGTREFSVRDLEQGFSMQMLIYLMALCRGQYPALNARLGLPEGAPLYPAGIRYLSSNVGTELTAGRKSTEDALRDATDRLKNSGITLNDPNVLRAISATGDERVLGNAKKHCSAEDFEQLFDQLESIVARIAQDMRSGDACAEPHAATGAGSPCNYCGFAPVCRSAKKSSY